MLLTFVDLHTAFLDGIKKSYAGTVTPFVFERLWNQWAMPIWLSKNVSLIEGIEVTQKQIDDLSPLMMEYILNFDNITYQVPDDYYIIPDGIMALSIFDINTNTDKLVVLPKYLRAVSVMFKLDYGTSQNQICNLTGISDFIGALYYRKDVAIELQKSIYRKPSDKVLYWDKVIKETYVQQLPPTTPPTYIPSQKIECIKMVNNGSKSVAMKLNYLKHPDEISAINNTGCELNETAKQEIIQTAVILFLERIKDPRYKTFLNEQNNQKYSVI